MERRRSLSNQEKFELLKMYYKDGITDFTGTKFEGYNVLSIRANLRVKYNNRKLKMDPELLKKFEGEYFLQRERRTRTTDEEKYEFLMKFYEKNPDTVRSTYSFTEKYEDGKKVKEYAKHLQVKHNKGKDVLTQEQIENLLTKNFLQYSPSEKEEIAQKYCISVRWIDDIQEKFGLIENFEDAIKKDIEMLNYLSLNDRFIWKGKEDATEEEKLAYFRLVESTFRLKVPNLKCLVVDPELIDEKLETLLWREKSCIKKIFGLENGKPKNLSEVAREFEVSPERIRQIKVRALIKLRNPSRRQEVKEDMLSYNLKDNMDEKKELEEKIESLESKKEDYAEILKQDDIDEEIRELRRLKSIHTLHLSVRTSNCLKRAGIETIEDLTKYSVDDMQKIRNLTKSSFEELLRKTERL